MTVFSPVNAVYDSRSLPRDHPLHHALSYPSSPILVFCFVPYHGSFSSSLLPPPRKNSRAQHRCARTVILGLVPVFSLVHIVASFPAQNHRSWKPRGRVLSHPSRSPDSPVLIAVFVEAIPFFFPAELLYPRFCWAKALQYQSLPFSLSVSSFSSF